MLHPDPLLDDVMAKREAPHRHASVELERFDVDVAGGIYDATRPAVAKERVRSSTIADRCVSLGEHQHATERWIDRCDQQAVISPGEGARDGACSVAAHAIREPPFATFG